MPAITPYLTVRDAAGAIAFYQKAFGAKEEMRMPADDGKRVLHAYLTIGGASLFLSDEFPEEGGASAPRDGQISAVAVALGLDEPGQVDRTFRQAVAAGAKGTMEPADMFWGDRFAMLQDPYGHRWMLNAPLEK
ncbi:MAG: VOC family protein [Xanthobacteraceae bacterium]